MTRSEIRMQFTAGLTLASLLLAGCASITPAAQTNHRVEEKRAVFNQLSERQQGDILGGAIERGNTTDMVYMAMGQPRKIVTSADGAKAMWVYNEYYTHSAPVTTGFNNPNSSHYMPMVTLDPNAPGPGASVPDPVNPGHFIGLPAYLHSAGFNSTTNPAMSQSLEIQELKRRTIYVFFFGGKVTEIKVAGDVADQKTAAANVAGDAKKTP